MIFIPFKDKFNMLFPIKILIYFSFPTVLIDLLSLNSLIVSDKTYNLVVSFIRGHWQFIFEYKILAALIASIFALENKLPVEFSFDIQSFLDSRFKNSHGVFLICRDNKYGFFWFFISF